MKKISYIIFASALLLGATSCGKEAPKEVSGPVTITASIADETKSTLSDSDGKFAFTTTDAIKVYNGTGTYSSTSTVVDGEGNATFTMADGFTDTGSGLAAMPAGIVTAINGSSVTFNLPTSYTYSQVGGADASAANVPCPMIASFTGGQDLSFKQAGSFVRFRIKECVAGDITFTFTSPVTGSVTVTGVPSAEDEGIHSTGLTGYSITVTDVPAVTGSEVLFITLPVPVGTDPMKVGVWNKGTSMNKVATLSGTVTPLIRAQGRKRGVSLSDVKDAATFSGYHLDGYLYNYDHTQYGILDDPLEILKHYGLHYEDKQYYFCWNDIITIIPDLFKSEGYQIGSKKYKAPSGGSDGEWRKIMGSGVGATIKDKTGHGTFANVTGLTPATYHTSSVRGFILFPDNAIVAAPDGITINSLDSKKDDIEVTKAQLEYFTNQGCAFFPCAGYYDDVAATPWGDIAVGGYYWSDTTYAADMAYALAFTYDGSAENPYSFSTYDAVDKKATAYFPIRLIRLN